MFQGAIIKLTAVCNLDCSYCYMFNLADRTFKSVPKYMSDEVVHTLARRLGDYVAGRRLSKFQVTLHGGEPSLLPRQQFVRLLESLRENCGDRIRLSLQTNGYKLDRQFLALCHEHDVGIGISLDGPKAYNDMHRYTLGGKGSYDRIMRNVGGVLSGPHANVLKGFLCVSNPDIPPAEFHAWILGLPLKRVNLLWPIEFNHDDRPPQPGAYGRWLLDIFHRWFRQDDPSVFIPLFLETIGHFMGSRSHTDQIVNDEYSLIVINTDGRYEYPDYFRQKGGASIDTGLRLSSNDLFDLERDANYRALANLRRYRPAECEGCSVAGVCGGGFLANRLKADRPLIADLSSRSILCEDHRIFFTGVREALAPFIHKAA